MKKLICAMICLIMLVSLAMPVLAAEDVFVFTDDSKFEYGGTANVDVMKTLANIMDLGKDAAEYNAALEGNVEFIWYRDGLSWGYDASFTFTQPGEYYCKVVLYEDAELSQRCGTYTSRTFTISAPIPEITTKSIPDGEVGFSYYCKLECTDPDVVYSLYRSSLPDGLYLTQHGEIEGIPTKAGFWYVVVMATPEAGEDYAAFAEYEITITDGPMYTLEIMKLPDKLVYTAGEKLDMKGLWVRIYTPDGFIDSRDGERLTYSDKQLVTLGEQKIKLAYEDAMEVIYVTVVEAPADTTEPDAPDAPDATEPDATEPAAESSEPEDVPTDLPAVDSNLVEKPVDSVAPGDPGDTTTDGAISGSGFFISDWLMIVLVAAVVLIVGAAVAVVIIVVAKNKKK